MVKYGYTRSGKQRWYCPKCRVTSTKTRPDIIKKKWGRLFTHWLLSNISLTQLSKKLKIGKRTLNYHFQSIWKQFKQELSTYRVYVSTYNQNTSTQQITQKTKVRVIILDATYVRRDYVVLIAKDLTHILGFGFYQKENYNSWCDFLTKLFPYPQLYPDIVVIDGKQGLMLALRSVFEDKVKIQRCLFHIHLLFRTYLSLKPKTKAGKELKCLVDQLSRVTTKSAMSSWLLRFFLWFSFYQPLLLKTPHPKKKNKADKPVWRYKHKKLRAAFSLIKNSLPYLFTFLYHPDVPRTTNHVEAGINARLKELIYRHRGLSKTKQKILISLFLKSKMKNQHESLFN